MPSMTNDREWNDKLRRNKWAIEDAKRTRRLFLLCIFGLIVFTAAWITLCVLFSSGYVFGVLGTLWGSFGMSWWGLNDNPLKTVRDYERERETLQDAYAHAMMEA